MKLSDLSRWSVPTRIIEAWRRRQGDALLPVQRRAIQKGLLGTGGAMSHDERSNMLISAPTSSGKSFCAELAAIKALTERKKAVLLFPLKSLAEEKYRVLKKTYEPLGVKCLIVTGDHPENDGRFAGGDYQIAVAIFEKFDLLLTAELDALKTIGCLCIDELQMLCDSGRGAVLERMLTKVLASEYNPRIVGLSAVIGEQTASALSRWLVAEVVEETARPVDLLKGVAATGSLQYRSHNSGEDGTEPFAVTEAGDDAVDVFMQQLKEGDGSTLVFVKSRMDTVSLAFRLSAAVNWPPASKAIEKLADEESTFLIRSLRQALGRGVGFHSSDLSSGQRSVVEQAFINKEIRVIFSTTTLAMGVNLPADTVYLETVKYSQGSYDGRPSLVPVTRAEFDNMSGRAGRLGMADSKPGKAIVLAESEFDRDILWDQYIAEPQSVESERPIDSAFHTIPLEDWVLHMVVSGLARCVSDLSRIYGCAYKAVSCAGHTPAFDRAIDLLCDGKQIRRGEQGELSSTPSGKATACTGLSCGQAVYLLDTMNRQFPESSFGWTALALSVPGIELPPGMLTRLDLADNGPVRMLYQRFDHSVEEVTCLIGKNHRREPLTFQQASALKALLLLDEWSRLKPAQSLEERYQIHLGQMLSLGEAAAHILNAAAGLIEVSDRENQVVDQIRRHAFSLKHGLPSELQALHNHFHRILNRADFAGLRRAGITSLSEMVGMDYEELSEVIKSKPKYMKLKGKIDKIKEEVSMSASQVNSMAMVCAEPESIEIDGSFERERYLVKINGYPVRLTGKSFKYFTKLAWSRQNRDSGWVYKEDIEIGFNQARYLYRMKNEIKAGIDSGWPIIENNRLGYYRLNVPPEKIAINAENLRDHPDCEIRDLVVPETAGSDQLNQATVQ